MRTFCDFCKSEYEIEASDIGVTVSCSACQKEFVVKAAVQCPDCRHWNPAAETQCGKCGKSFAAPPALPKLTVPKLNIRKPLTVPGKTPAASPAQTAGKPQLAFKTSPFPAAPKAQAGVKPVNTPGQSASAPGGALAAKPQVKPDLQLTPQPAKQAASQPAKQAAPQPEPQLTPQPEPQSKHYIEFDADKSADDADDGSPRTFSIGYLRLCRTLQLVMAFVVALTILVTSGFTVKKLCDRINLVLHKEKRKEKQRLFFEEMFAKDENFQRHAGELGIRFEKFDAEKEQDPNYFSNLSKRKIMCVCSAGGYVAIEAEVQLQFLGSGVKIADAAWRQAESDVRELFGIRDRINSLNAGKCIRVEGINWKEVSVHRNKQTYTVWQSAGEAVFLMDGKEVKVPFKVERGTMPQLELPDGNKTPEVKPAETMVERIKKRIPASRRIELDEDDPQKAE